MSHEKLRILIPYASDYGNISIGGIQRFILCSLNTTPNDYSITLLGVGNRPKGLPKEIDWVSNFSKDELPKRNLHLYFAIKMRKQRNWLSKFDITVHHRVETLLFARYGKMDILNLHSPTWGAVKTRGIFRGIALIVFELLAAIKANVVLSVNPSGVSKLTKVLCKEIKAVPVPVSSIYFSSETPPSNRRLIYVGRLEKGKNVDAVLQLGKKYGYPVEVIGEGLERFHLERMANEMKIGATFHGFLKESEIAQIFKNGGIFATASVSEGFPISILEALASRLPIALLSRKPWTKSLITFGVKPMDKLDLNELGTILDVHWQLLQNRHGELAAANLFWATIKDASQLDNRTS